MLPLFSNFHSGAKWVSARGSALSAKGGLVAFKGERLDQRSVYWNLPPQQNFQGVCGARKRTVPCARDLRSHTDHLISLDQSLFCRVFLSDLDYTCKSLPCIPHLPQLPVSSRPHLTLLFAQLCLNLLFCWHGGSAAFYPPKTGLAFSVFLRILIQKKERKGKKAKDRKKAK